ncbi:hypothetical protein B0G69_0114 [Paraburkholderia sp. RAU2J]|nr:hypothetical protein B0G69_0114 [Paraburkholderia sp. RAU2J]
MPDCPKGSARSKGKLTNGARKDARNFPTAGLSALPRGLHPSDGTRPINRHAASPYKAF